jgi:hypothetical protein
MCSKGLVDIDDPVFPDQTSGCPEYRERHVSPIISPKPKPAEKERKVLVPVPEPRFRMTYQQYESITNRISELESQVAFLKRTPAPKPAPTKQEINKVAPLAGTHAKGFDVTFNRLKPKIANAFKVDIIPRANQSREIPLAFHPNQIDEMLRDGLLQKAQFGYEFTDKVKERVREAGIDTSTNPNSDSMMSYRGKMLRWKAKLVNAYETGAVKRSNKSGGLGFANNQFNFLVSRGILERVSERKTKLTEYGRHEIEKLMESDKPENVLTIRDSHASYKITI